MIYSGRWSAIRRGRGDLPPIVEGLQFFGDLSCSRTSIVSGAVATLGDSSGYNRDATQGTAGNRPTYNASDSDFGGMPSMSGDGVSRYISTAAFQVAANDATYFVVAKAGTSTGASRVWDHSRVYGGAVSTTSRRSMYSTGGFTFKDTTVSAGSVYRIASVFAAATPSAAVPKVYLNGADTGAAYGGTAATNAGLTSVPLTLFGTSGGAGLSDEKIATVLAYAGQMTATQIAIVDDWLKWRFSL